MNYYYLVGHEIRITTDPLVWAQWLESNDHSVAYTTDGVDAVSTVFIGGIQVMGEGLFETLYFARGESCVAWRSHTWEEAEYTHRMVVERCIRNYWVLPFVSPLLNRTLQATWLRRLIAAKS